MKRSGWCLWVGLLLSAALPAAEPVRPNGVVVLMTDYGNHDSYVGVLKGVVVSACAEARIFDATHEVPNFDVAAASYLLGRVAPYWPNGTTFVVVVDPGVGTPRKKIAVETQPDGKRFVCPDNGLLTDVLERAAGFRAFELTNERLKRPGAESTSFHGRDWFGPVGGHLAGGTPIEQVGPALSEVTRLPRVAPHLENGELVGTVIYVDHYGNALTNIGRELLQAAGWRERMPLRVRLGDGPWTAMPWVRAYGEVPRGRPLVLCPNSEGRLEVAINYGSAKERLGAVNGQTIRVRPEAER